MKFIALIYVSPEDAADDDRTALDAHLDFAASAIRAGAYVTCDGLEPPPNARTVRVRDGQSIVTDGPYAETKEVLGGFYILDCATIEDAVALAAGIPAADRGAIEVRPIAVIPGWDEALATRVAAATAASATT